MTKKPIIALIYDFDGTLARGNIQENSFIPEIGMDTNQFWKTVEKNAKKHDMDGILSYMHLIIKQASTSETPVTQKAFKKHGKTVKYFDGVESYFNRINKYGESIGLEIEHYIVSSGTKEMIEGTSIAKYFKKIYACSYMFDENGVPVWPAQAINYTTKTQFLFRINKGIENSWDNKKINEYTPDEDRRIPFDHMIYLGDGLTDVPAMKMTKQQGGTVIGVYDKTHRGEKKQVTELLNQDRVDFVAPADYRNNTDIDKIIKEQLNIIASQEKMKKLGGK